MFEIKRLNLQLFADGGDGGGEGAATSGESAADAGQDTNSRLLELGVPESKLRNRAKKSASAAKTAQQTQQAASADTNTEDSTPVNNSARMSWDEIKADPEYNAEMQKMMQERVKKSKEAEDTLAKLAPLVPVLAKKYGLDPNSPDIHDSLTQAVYKDDGNFEDQALEEGKPVEEIRQQAHKNLEQQRIQQHIQKLEQQGEALKQVVPGFDLRKELQNPAFARMTAPNVGISVEDAYYAIHRKELMTGAMQAAQKITAQKFSNSIQAGQRRPAENGTTGQAASVTAFDYSKASKQQRDDLKKQIRAAAARGEKIYPGR